jgi:hypothetical protein
MYDGECDLGAFEAVAAAAKAPVVYNGDVSLPAAGTVMVGRGFVRALGEREDAAELLLRYVDASMQELSGERPVLGRIKELVAYWKESPRWRRRWQSVKIARTLDELRLAIGN